MRGAKDGTAGQDIFSEGSQMRWTNGWDMISSVPCKIRKIVLLREVSEVVGASLPTVDMETIDEPFMDALTLRVDVLPSIPWVFPRILKTFPFSLVLIFKC